MIMSLMPDEIILYLKMTSPGFLEVLYGNPFGILAMSFLIDHIFAVCHGQCHSQKVSANRNKQKQPHALSIRDSVQTNPAGLPYKHNPKSQHKEYYMYPHILSCAALPHFLSKLQYLRSVFRACKKTRKLRRHWRQKRRNR